ncbi:hypothetical protein LK540_12150 [Massilia sp. IC2-278]|uniref:hypothetical protein n=1 Tax=Massilia sp. IC2-278 TaxID=2887200 RepID=UPI001E34CB28|nr:hypothetical protein [Massilia sp. IC2-278]MCC2961174.1 hypothetical protein [Massilia sp. IC2-278]
MVGLEEKPQVYRVLPASAGLPDRSIRNPYGGHSVPTRLRAHPFIRGRDDSPRNISMYGNANETHLETLAIHIFLRIEQTLTMLTVPRGHFVFEAPGLKDPTVRAAPQAHINHRGPKKTPGIARR